MRTPETLIFSEASVPTEYTKDPIATDGVEYAICELTKYEPDEKEISEVYLPGKADKEVRVGWLIPAISVLSKEHDYFNNKYFRKHAFELYNAYIDKTIDDRTYFFIYSKRLNESCAVNSKSIVIHFCRYGIYPLIKHHSCHLNHKRIKIPSKIHIKNTLDIHQTTGFLQLMFYKSIQSEENPYARFMFFYQIIELLIELTFYSKIQEFRKLKNHLGTVRKKIEEYSSESKLITTLYQLCNIHGEDLEFSQKCSSLFPHWIDIKDKPKSDMIYKFRNAIVHNYFRLNFDLDMYFSDHLEMDIYKILDEIFNDDSLSSLLFEFKENYIQ